MTYAGGANGGTMMCKEIEGGVEDPPLQCGSQALAPAADFGLGNEASSYFGPRGRRGVTADYRRNWARRAQTGTLSYRSSEVPHGTVDWRQYRRITEVEMGGG